MNNVNVNICRDGRRVWMTWTNRAIRDERGQVTEILAVGSSSSPAPPASSVATSPAGCASAATRSAALVRALDRGRELEALGCELVVGDLADSGAIETGLQGCDALIHGAAVYEVGIPESEHRRDVRGERARHRAGPARGVGGRDTEGRLRLDRGRLRQHPRPGGRRVLPAPRHRLHLLLRADEVRGAPNRHPVDRRRRASVRDRSARRRLRPRRSLRPGSADARLPRRANAAAAVPRSGHEPGPRRRRRRRDPARPRPRRRRASPTCLAAR